MVSTGVIAAGLAPASASAAIAVSGPSKRAKIISPRLDALRAGGEARVAVQVSPGRSWRVRVDDRRGDKEVSQEFHRVNPGIWAARLGRSDGLQPGANRIWLLSRRGSGDWKATGQRFVFGARERDLVSLGGPRGRTESTRARIRIGANAETDHLRVSLNGRRVEQELRERREGEHSATLSASHGLRYGKNRLTVRSYDFGGDFEVERLAFEVDRKRPLAAAGRDRRATEGHAVRLDGGRSRPTNERKRLSFHWEVVRSPLGSNPGLQNEDRSRPQLRTDVHGTYLLRLTVTEVAAGGGRAKAEASDTQSSSDLVMVTTQPDAPPIGVPIQTLADPRGTPTVCPPASGASPDGPGVAVGERYYGSPGGPIQLLVLDSATLECELNESYDGTSLGLGLLAQAVQDLTTDPAKLVVITSSGTQIAQSSVASVNKTLSLIGAEPLSGTAVDGPFSVIGSRDGKLGTATANPGLHALENPATPGWPGDDRFQEIRAGALLGFMTLSADESGYSFVSPEFVPFSTNHFGGPCVEAECGGWGTLEPPATGGFAVMQLDAGTAGVAEASSRVFPTNGTGNDEAAQQALAQALAEIANDPGKIVLIQSMGAPAATTPAWSFYTKGALTGIAAEIVKLGGTADVFNRLDGTISYALVGGAGIQGPAAEMASKLPVPCIKNATWAECQSQDTGDVVMHATQSPAQLTGLLAKNNASGFQAVVGGVSGDETIREDTAGLNHMLLKVAYQDPAPGGWPYADQVDALKYVAQNVVCSSQCALDDPRRAYYADGYSHWGDKAKSVLTLCYPWDADCTPPNGYRPPSTQPTFDEATFDGLLKQLSTEFSYVSAVQGFLGVPDPSSGTPPATMQQLFDAQSPQIQVSTIAQDIKDSVNASNDDQALSEAWQIMAIATSVASTLLEPTAEEGELDALGLMSDGYWLGAAIAPESDGAGAFTSLDTTAIDLETTLTTQLQDQAAELNVVGQIIVSDWGKLSAIGAPLTKQPLDPEWDINQGAALRSLSNSTTQQIYAALMPTVYQAYQLESAGGRNSNPVGADPWHWRSGRCGNGTVAYGQPFNFDESGHSLPRTGGMPMVYDIGGTQASPTRTAHWWAWGTGRIAYENITHQQDFHVPSANLTDPLFAPPEASVSSWTSPRQQGVGMFPSWFWTRTWPKPKVLSC